MTWRARQDACRSAAEIAVMSPVRRERALAVRAAAEAMWPLSSSATPHGRVAALRVVLGVPSGEDWAERHRTRERERMRRRHEAGDPKLAAERARAREKARTPEGRAAAARKAAASYAARKARKAVEAERAAEVSARKAEERGRELAALRALRQ